MSGKMASLGMLNYSDFSQWVPRSKHQAAGGTVRTPGDMIMAGPRFEAGNSQPRRVRPSRVVNSTPRRGKALAVIAFFRKELSWRQKMGMMVVAVRGTGPVWLYR